MSGSITSPFLPWSSHETGSAVLYAIRKIIADNVEKELDNPRGVAPEIKANSCAQRRVPNQQGYPEMRLTNRIKQAGATGYILLWLLGIPIPILLLIFLLRGCT